MFTTVLKYIAIIFLLDFIYIQSGAVNYASAVFDIQGSGFAGRSIGLLAYPLMAYALTTTKSTLEAAQLGFIIYSIFNLTNYYLFKNWYGQIAIADTIWGTCLFAVTKYLVQV